VTAPTWPRKAGKSKSRYCRGKEKSRPAQKEKRKKKDDKELIIKALLALGDPARRKGGRVLQRWGEKLKVPGWGKKKKKVLTQVRSQGTTRISFVSILDKGEKKSLYRGGSSKGGGKLSLRKRIKEREEGSKGRLLPPGNRMKRAKGAGGGKALRRGEKDQREQLWEEKEPETSGP